MRTGTGTCRDPWVRSPFLPAALLQPLYATMRTHPPMQICTAVGLILDTSDHAAAHGLAWLCARQQLPAQQPFISTCIHDRHQRMCQWVRPDAGFGPGFQGPLYKTRLCFKFMDTGSCEKGASCSFAHGKHELRPGPDGSVGAPV